MRGPPRFEPGHETLQQKGQHQTREHRHQKLAHQAQQHKSADDEQYQVDRVFVREVLVNPVADGLQELHGFFCIR